MRTIEKIYASVVVGRLPVEHLFSLFKILADLFPLGGIRDVDITPSDLQMLILLHIN